jgi:hypothetical protein
MTELVDILKFIGPDLAFPAILIFAVLWFLMKILKPMFESTNETFKQYIITFQKMSEDVHDTMKALEGIERNTRHRKDDE